MTAVSFTLEAVTSALRSGDWASVEVVERFPASSAEVARLRLGSADGRRSCTVIGKSATGAGLEAARRERRFFEGIAPLWDHPGPQFLGACEQGEGEEARLLLLTEDLEAAGYHLPSSGAAPAQLEAVVDTLVRQHSRFWEDLQPGLLPTYSGHSVTRAAQAWPVATIEANALAVRAETLRFLDALSAEMAPFERALLDEVLDGWEHQFLARVDGGRAVTLIHGDLHLLGNLFFSPDLSSLRVIDWSEFKPGLGPHDLAFALISAPAERRVERDMALLQRYWDGLRAAGIGDYGWELCQWDYRFSLLTNLFQSVFQGSAVWFHKTTALVEELGCRAALRQPPPR